MKRFIQILAAVLLSVPLCAAENGKPNILFIFADDLTYEAVGAMGMTDIETPNLDRLARSGTMFTHAYNMGSWSGAVCVASRTMLMTGRTVWHAEKVYNTAEQERQAGRLWPEIMKKAGYKTYFTGKWHVKADAEKAFDVARHIRAGMPKDTKDAYGRPQSETEDSWSPTDPKFGGYWEGGKHWSVVAADDAVDYLGMAKNDSNPFFMYIAFNAPHDPRQSPQEYLDKYPLSRIKPPEGFLPEYPYKDQIGCGQSLRDEALAPFPRTEYAVKVHRREYYSLITHLDAQIGRILDTLEKSGLAGNTVIFFSADHGLSVGHHGLLGKQNPYDVSVRVPFFIAGPGIPAGQRIDTPIMLQDGMATSLELAGVQKPEHVEFHSLLPMAKDPATPGHYEAVYGSYLKMQRSISFGGHKLILYPKAPKARLYDLKADPHETRDLSGNPDSLPLMRSLFARFLELQQKYDDDLDVNSAFPELATPNP